MDDEALRRQAARRIAAKLAAPAYVEVTRLPLGVEERLADLERRARWDRRHALLVVEHRPRNLPPVWLVAVHVTHLEGPVRSVTETLSSFLVAQQWTRKAPHKAWRGMMRRARAVPGHAPILVSKGRGATQGVALAPLAWFFKQEAPLEAA